MRDLGYKLEKARNTGQKIMWERRPAKAVYLSIYKEILNKQEQLAKVGINLFLQTALFKHRGLTQKHNECFKIWYHNFGRLMFIKTRSRPINRGK